MKKIIYITILLAFASGIISCNMDLDPENALTYSNSFKTEKELNTTTTSILVFTNFYIKDNPAFMEAGVLKDESNGSNDYSNWNQKRVAKNAPDWKELYNIVFESNLLLDNIHRTTGLTEDRYNYHAGQAHFALGLTYLVLTQRYGDCVITENSSTIKEYTTSPMTQVLNKAIEHAQKAYEILPIDSSAKNKQYACKGSSAALLAHLYAWKGSIIELYELEGDAKACYRKSIEYASALIDGKAGSYSLCSSTDELCNYLSDPDKSNPEEIYTISFDYTRSTYAVSPNIVASNFCSWPVNKTVEMTDIVNWSTRYRLHKSTVEKLFPDENDTRRKSFFYEFDKEHNVAGNDYAIMHKYRNAIHTPNQYSPSGLSFRTINANYTYWRLADIILLRGECYAKLGDEGKATADLNLIRNRAKASPYPSTNDKDGLQKAIFQEREREFLGENDARYFDIIRNNYIKTELNGNFKTLTKQDIKNGALTLPIPTGAYKNSEGLIVNTKIKQKRYWIPFL